MSGTGRGARLEVQLGRLLLRSNRTGMYATLVDNIDGIDTTTYPVLSGLARVGPTTATHLAVEVGLDRTAVTRYLSRLEQAGHVTRTPHTDDRRATRVALTSQGSAVVATMRRALGRSFDDILDSWSSRDAESFVTGLERFVTTLIDQNG